VQNGDFIVFELFNFLVLVGL